NGQGGRGRQMVQARPPGYRVQIASEPPGASVELDGVPHGRTPLEIANLQPGSHAIRLRLPGYRDLIRPLRVDGDRRESYRLTPEQVTQYPLTIESDPA